MAEESLPVPAVRFHDIVQRFINPEREAGQKFQSIGAVWYDQRSKVLLAASTITAGLTSFEGRVSFVHIDGKDFPDPSGLIDSGGKFTDLSHLSDLQAVQIGFTAVPLETKRSLLSRPSVYIHLIRDEGEKTLTDDLLPEEDILFALTGERGGVVTFSGSAPQEEVVLLLERTTVDKKRVGIMLFFHPTETERNMGDSVLCFQKFLEQLNREFCNDDVSFSLQNEALVAVEKEIKAGRLVFESGKVGETFFKAVVIAHARLASLTKDYRHLKTLEYYLPSLRSNLIGRVLSIFAKHPGAEGLLKKTFVRSLDKRDELEEERAVLGQPIKSEFLFELRERAQGEFFADPLKSTTQRYVSELVKFVGETSTIGYLDDALVLLEELRGFSYLQDTHPAVVRYLFKNENKSDLNGLTIDFFSTNASIRKEWVSLLSESSEMVKRRKDCLQSKSL